MTGFNLEPSYLDVSLSRILIKGEQTEAWGNGVTYWQVNKKLISSYFRSSYRRDVCAELRADGYKGRDCRAASTVNYSVLMLELLVKMTLLMSKYKKKKNMF